MLVARFQIRQEACLDQVKRLNIQLEGWIL